MLHMRSSLESRLEEYLRVVESMFAKERKRQPRIDHPGSHPSEEERLRRLVKDLERQDEFAALVRAAQDEYPIDIEGLDVKLDAGPLIKNFLRRTGLYLDAWAGKRIELESVVDLFRQAFRPGEVKTTHLAPLEGVEFAEDRIDFANFRIERFDDPREFDAILENRIRRVFYPWAAIDANELRWHWILVTSGPACGAGAFDDDLTRVRVKYSPFPDALARCLRTLFLFPWHGVSVHGGEINLGAKGEDRDPWAGPQHFHVPFHFSISGSVTDAHPAAPDLSALEREEPDGSEFGGGPVYRLHLDPGETQKFATFVREAAALTAEALNGGPSDWRFMDVALNFFVKGCLTPGLEGLLWHITTIEALVGEKNESGLTKLLRRRVKTILGSTEQEKRNVGRKFDELYDLRSALVHGSSKLPDRAICFGHLGEAYEISRRMALWMLRYLRAVRAGFGKDISELPSRDDLLRVLDILDMDDRSRAQVSQILACLPSEFSDLSR
jgi:hypothetical protein